LVTENKSEPNNLIVNAIKHPFSLAILILSIVILIVWSDQRGDNKQNGGDVASSQPDNTSTPTSDGTQNEIVLKPPTLANSGRSVPKIVEQLGGNTAGQAGGAPGLESLIGGLEAKVKADPSNLNNRILLAQTYNHLGLSDKAVKELRIIQVENPKNVQVNLVLGSILSKSTKPEELNESIALLDNIEQADERQKYLIEMHRGDAFNGLKQNDKALSHWKKALSLMPESDSRYAKLQQQIKSQSKN